jgi:hypothetical protein
LAWPINRSYRNSSSLESRPVSSPGCRYLASPMNFLLLGFYIMEKYERQTRLWGTHAQANRLAPSALTVMRITPLTF